MRGSREMVQGSTSTDDIKDTLGMKLNEAEERARNGESFRSCAIRATAIVILFVIVIAIIIVITIKILIEILIVTAIVFVITNRHKCNQDKPIRAESLPGDGERCDC